MLFLMFSGLAICAAVGGIIYLVFKALKDQFYLTKDEWPILAFVLVAIVALTSFIGYKVAIDNNLSYHEFWGGFEVKVYTNTYYCQESNTQGGYTGGCVNYYDGDSYEVWVESESCHTDRKGHEHCRDTSHWETRYRQIPYTTTETSYYVATTLGDFTIGSHWLPSNPQSHRIYPRHSWLESIPSDLQSGIPSFWLKAQKRIDSGNPGPVTAQKNYNNYILASQETILHKFSPWIGDYQKRGLMPDIDHNITDFYYLNRVYFLGGLKVGDEKSFEKAMNKFDASFGSTLQGDLYLVAMPANSVHDPHKYVQSLVAYWQSKKFGKYALSKNGVVVVVGVGADNKIVWSRASTGMPSGNELMLLDIAHNLPGVDFNANALLGCPQAIIGQNKTGYVVSLKNNNGALAQIIWGQDSFKRVHMGNQKNSPGYLYLKGEIQPTFWQEFWILFFITIASAAAWGIALAYAAPIYQSYRRN